MSNISMSNKKDQLTFSLFVLFFFSRSATFREEDKNIFDYCRENNIDHVSEAISSQKVDVNTKDEEVAMKRDSRKYVVSGSGELTEGKRNDSTKRCQCKQWEGGSRSSAGKCKTLYSANAKTDVAFKSTLVKIHSRSKLTPI